MQDADRLKADAFIDLIIAGMKDAAVESKLTQFKVTITPEETGRQTFVRVIIVPETMDFERAEAFQSV